MSFGDIIWVLIVLQFFVPLFQRRLLDLRRAAALRALEQRFGGRVITMIHRQETLSFLGFPIVRYIDIEDSERVLRAIRLTGADVPIQVVLHTPGGSSSPPSRSPKRSRVIRPTSRSSSRTTP